MNRIPGRGINPSLAELRRQRLLDARVLPIDPATSQSHRASFAAYDVSAKSDSVLIIPEPDAWRTQDLEARIRNLEETLAHLERLRPATDTPSWIDAANEELLLTVGDALRDNWDGEGSLGVKPQTWQLARMLLTRLATRGPKPEIGVGRHGQVTLDWWGEANSALTVEVLPDGRIVFACVFEDPRLGMRGTELLSEESALPPASIEFALARLANGR